MDKTDVTSNSYMDQTGGTIVSYRHKCISPCLRTDVKNNTYMAKTHVTNNSFMDKTGDTGDNYIAKTGVTNNSYMVKTRLCKHYIHG